MTFDVVSIRQNMGVGEKRFEATPSGYRMTNMPLVIAVMTTNNSDLIRGLMFFRLPLDYALMIVLALNFVPKAA